MFGHKGQHRESGANDAPRARKSTKPAAKAVGRAKAPLPPAKNVEGLLARAVANLAKKKKS